MRISERIMALALAGAAVSVFLSPFQPVLAAGTPFELTEKLEAVYASRPDLRACFRPDDWTAISGTRAGGLTDLEDWARHYGYAEYPGLLGGYAPGGPQAAGATPVDRLPPALSEKWSAYVPELKDGAKFDFGRLSAQAVLVIDVGSRQFLLARNSRQPHPIASITKLMTAMVSLDRRTPLYRSFTMNQDDEVGGASLRMGSVRQFTTADLFYAMVVGSANNAAHALARSTGLSIPEFVAAMNGKASDLGLAATVFADPTGLETGNVSTPVDTAALALEAFERYYLIRKAASTAAYDIVAAGRTHRVKNTNELLTDETNGLVVLGGKTGYLDESKWNLVTKIRDTRNKPLLIVIFGSETKQRLFQDAETVARWTWENYRWVRNSPR